MQNINVFSDDRLFIINFYYFSVNTRTTYANYLHCQVILKSPDVENYLNIKHFGDREGIGRTFLSWNYQF